MRRRQAHRLRTKMYPFEPSMVRLVQARKLLAGPILAILKNGGARSVIPTTYDEPIFVSYPLLMAILEQIPAHVISRYYKTVYGDEHMAISSTTFGQLGLCDAYHDAARGYGKSYFWPSWFSRWTSFTLMSLCRGERTFRRPVAARVQILCENLGSEQRNQTLVAQICPRPVVLLDRFPLTPVPYICNESISHLPDVRPRDYFHSERHGQCHV